jgi:hypothetical protein
MAAVSEAEQVVLLVVDVGGIFLYLPPVSHLEVIEGPRNDPAALPTCIEVKHLATEDPSSTTLNRRTPSCKQAYFMR